MLVAGDFSDSDQSQANHHSSSHFYLSDIYASYLSRIALSTDSGHGLKLCIEKDIYGRRGENAARRQGRSEEHTSELQSLMRISYAVFCLKKKNKYNKQKYANPNTMTHNHIIT